MYKTFIASIAFLMCALVASGQGQLKVTVKNIREVEGTVRVGLFRNSAEFLKQPVYGKVVSLTADSVIVTFEDLPAGTYGISVFHDRNDNGKLDTNILGIPKEGFAFGENAMGLFGPPSFKSASVTIGNMTVQQVIELRYF